MPRRSTLRTLVGALLVALFSLGAPAVRAQEGGPLYFPATGHILSDDAGFLTFWQTHNGERLLGPPVSEAFEAEGATIQYFERGRLEFRVDPASGVGIVRTGGVAKEYADALYRTFAPAPPRSRQYGAQVFSETDHTLAEPFLGFWQANGALEFFGAPISEPIWEKTSAGQRQVQYFTNVRLERDPSLMGTPNEIQVGSLGRSLALLRGVDTAALDNPGYATAGPAVPLAADIAQIDTPTRAVAPTPAPEPAPAAKPAAPAKGPVTTSNDAKEKACAREG